MTAIIKKELKICLCTMPGYIFTGAFVLLVSVFFGIVNIDGRIPFFGNVLADRLLMFLTLMTVPAITMRLFAEERRQKTEILLLSAPISPFSLVLGKYIAALTLFSAALLITGIFPWLLGFFTVTYRAEIMSVYLGYFLLGAGFIAVGIYVSALFENPAAAFGAAFAVLVVIFFLSAIASGMPADRISSLLFMAVIALILAAMLYNSTKSLIISGVSTILSAAVILIIFTLSPSSFDGLIIRFLRAASPLDRNTGFSTGLIHLSDILFYLSQITLFLYLTVAHIRKGRF